MQEWKFNPPTDSFDSCNFLFWGGHLLADRPRRELVDEMDPTLNPWELPTKLHDLGQFRYHLATIKPRVSDLLYPNKLSWPTTNLHFSCFLAEWGRIRKKYFSRCQRHSVYFQSFFRSRVMRPWVDSIKHYGIIFLQKMEEWGLILNAVLYKIVFWLWW